MKRAHFTYFPHRNISYVYCFTPQVPGTYLISLLFPPEPSTQHNCRAAETQAASVWADSRRRAWPHHVKERAGQQLPPSQESALAEDKEEVPIK